MARGHSFFFTATEDLARAPLGLDIAPPHTPQPVDEWDVDARAAREAATLRAVDAVHARCKPGAEKIVDGSVGVVFERCACVWERGGARNPLGGSERSAPPHCPPQLPLLSRPGTQRRDGRVCWRGVKVAWARPGATMQQQAGGDSCGAAATPTAPLVYRWPRHTTRLCVATPWKFKTTVRGCSTSTTRLPVRGGRGAPARASRPLHAGTPPHPPSPPPTRTHLLLLQTLPSCRTWRSSL